MSLKCQKCHSDIDNFSKLCSKCDYTINYERGIIGSIFLYIYFIFNFSIFFTLLGILFFPISDVAKHHEEIRDVIVFRRELLFGGLTIIWSGLLMPLALLSYASPKKHKTKKKLFK
jgi:hypothetical protein